MKKLLNEKSMKNIVLCSALAIAMATASCVSQRRVDDPIKFSSNSNLQPMGQPQPIQLQQPQPAYQQPQTIQPTQQNCCPPASSGSSTDQDSMIPFTRDLYYRLKNNNQDIRKLQFFVDQTLVLSRGTSQDKLYIDKARVMNQYGINENKIELLAYTPGVVEAIEPDGLRVSFESAGNNIKFINNRYSPEFFIFSGTNWDNGTAEVSYKGTTYRASCGTCGSVADARLVVRQKDIMAGETKTLTLPGRVIQ